jgi:hypothetical protein
MKNNLYYATVLIRKSQQLFLYSIKKICCIVLFLCLYWSLAVNAQTPAPPTDSYVNFESGQGTVYVAVSDTTTISEVEIQIGSKGVQDAVFSHSYVFDQTTGMPSGMTYSRTGLQLYLGMGTISPPPAVDVRVRLKDTSGNWSSWLEYVSN